MYILYIKNVKKNYNSALNVQSPSAKGGGLVSGRASGSDTTAVILKAAIKGSNSKYGVIKSFYLLKVI